MSTNIDIDIHSLSYKEFQQHKLIDIREANELAHFPSIVPCEHIPFSDFPENITAFNKNDSYLLFCAMGGRSHHMAHLMVEQGYKAASVNNGIGAVNAYLSEHVPSK